MDQQIQKCVRGGKLANSKIDFTKDSEYIRLFGDEKSEEFMESVYKKELGSSFETIENGVGVGNYESEFNEKTMERKGTDTRSVKTSRQKSEEDTC